MVSDYRIRKISDYLGVLNELIADMEQNGFSNIAKKVKEVKERLYDELSKELGYS